MAEPCTQVRRIDVLTRLHVAQMARAPWLIDQPLWGQAVEQCIQARGETDGTGFPVGAVMPPACPLASIGQTCATL